MAWRASLQGEAPSTCKFCGECCYAFHQTPPQACCCDACLPSFPRDSTEVDAEENLDNDDGGTLQEAIHTLDSSCTTEGKHGDRWRARECRCVMLRQLCRGSYSRFVQNMVRFGNWHTTASDSTYIKNSSHKVVESEDTEGINGTVNGAPGGDAATPERVTKALQRKQQQTPPHNDLPSMRLPALPRIGRFPSSGSEGRNQATGVSISEAAVVGDSDVFWVFGYGSLIWKTDGLPAKERVPGYIKGFRRVFFQLSDDHRGTQSSPGLVANLLPVEVYRDFIMETAYVAQASNHQQGEREPSAGTLGDGGVPRHGSTSQSSPYSQLMEDEDEGIVHGVALKFSAVDLEAVISKLDYRERGGYVRILVEFFPLEEERLHPLDRNQTINAFVYVGLPCNRYFYCFPDLPLSPLQSNSDFEEPMDDNWEQEAEDSAAGRSSRRNSNSSGNSANGGGNVLNACCPLQGGRNQQLATANHVSTTALLCSCCPDDLAHAAGMILRGEGASGPNTEYLFNLADFLRKIGQVDSHVFGLELRVKQLMKQQASRDQNNRENEEFLFTEARKREQ
ncbi:cation transport regulator-like protein 2 [Cyclospora cayetanensis]|uniref:glutathione-specific gamma-glutamylcyclotransferase n=1 Tax=Cyclospora cayetanensis TaxID=88456 RepID=A0A1D3CYD6_9EIME|nr:cation transport regulator-like protein 2 [Cyclospora cayetanensis]